MRHHGTEGREPVERADDDRHDEEVDELIEWLRRTTHLPNVTGTVDTWFLIVAKNKRRVREISA